MSANLGAAGSLRLAIAASVILASASCSARPPDPIVVLENPATGEQAKFFREIPYKVPAGYDEKKHVATWRAERVREGFTVVVKE